MIEKNDVRILRKIQKREYDEEVDEFLKNSLNWYKEHADDLGVIEKKTTIQLRQSTKDKLAKVGGKDDTYDDIIKKLINFYNEH